MNYEDRKKCCLIYNFAQHYRTNIFQLMDKELQCDFVFGDKYLDVKKMDYSLLSNVKEVKNVHLFGNWYFQEDVLPLVTKYKNLIIVGDVHCISTWLILAIAKIFHTRVYLWAHGWYGKEGSIVKVLKKIYFGMATGILLYGTYAKRLMLENGFTESKLYVIYNSLDYDNQIVIRQGISKTDVFLKHYNNSNHNIVFVGRLTPVKRLDLLLEAVSILRKRGLIINLTFIGDGKMRQTLQELTKTLSLDDNVWFYGPCYNESRLAELIYNADLCVSPGNVGLTAMHSMVFGTPVITHDNFPYQMPEFEAIEKGYTGDFFKYDNIDSLVETIDNWISNNEGRREEIRNSCFNVIDTKYNPHNQIEALKEIL